MGEQDCEHSTGLRDVGDSCDLHRLAGIYIPWSLPQQDFHGCLRVDSDCSMFCPSWTLHHPCVSDCLDQHDFCFLPVLCRVDHYNLLHHAIPEDEYSQHARFPVELFSHWLWNYRVQLHCTRCVPRRRRKHAAPRTVPHDVEYRIRQLNHHKNYPGPDGCVPIWPWPKPGHYHQHQKQPYFLHHVKHVCCHQCCPCLPAGHVRCFGDLGHENASPFSSLSQRVQPSLVLVASDATSTLHFWCVPGHHRSSFWPCHGVAGQLDWHQFVLYFSLCFSS